MAQFRGSMPGRRTGLLAVALISVLMAVTMLSKGNSAAGAGSPVGPVTKIPSEAAAPPSASSVSKIGAEVLQDTANGKSTTFLVLMSDQADLTAAYGMKDQDARGWYVFNTLRNHANNTQAGLRAMLQSANVTYKAFWISNALAVTGDRALVERIAARPDVSKIEGNRPFKAIDPRRNVGAPSNSPSTVEWGVQNVKAPQVWAMGYTGQGIIIGNADTGMRWTHQAIKGHYRGWNGATANHNYNWWDGIRAPTPGNPCGLMPSREPCDDDELLGGGHGTHTTGTTNGDDGQGNQIGVAPGAKWMGCRNLDRGVGYPVSYLECFQFFLAPHDLDGNNPNPTLRPHVENNSWTCIEGCAGDILKPAVENSQAAGIFIEASAGNDGPACSTIAWEPQIFEATFDTGAIDITNTLAEFSSRGPVVRDGSLRLKPNISAPGVNVRSSLRGSDTAYGSLDGTSMAGPHTVGVVALIWSARPDLVRNITETKVLLQQSANPNVTVIDPLQDCGGTTPNDIPNNHFGWGRIDALAALTRAGATVTPQATVTALPTFTVGTPMPTRTPASPFPTATLQASTATGTNTALAGTATQTNVAGTSTSTAVAPTSSAVATNTTLITSTATTSPISTLAATGTNTAVLPTVTSSVPPSSSTPTRTQTPGILTATPSVTLAATSTATASSTTTRTATRTTTSTPITTPTAIPTCQPSAGSRDVIIRDYEYWPEQNITISAGTTVRWLNDGPSPHTATSDTAVWDSGALNPGQTYQYTFGTPGTFPYHCTLHPGMVGSVTVVAGCPPTTTPTRTGTPTGIASSATPTRTGTPTATLAATSTSTSTRINTATVLPDTRVPTSTVTETAIVTATSTACTISFTDVNPDNTFYTWIRCLACRFIISGYSDGTFRPFNDITRGQIAKMVSNAAGFDEDPGPQIYEDVDGNNPFYQWINRLSMRGHMGGYPCGTVDAEPCIQPDNRPYFRPFANATRGQLAKIVANAAGVGGTPTGVFYTDVQEDNPFYVWIMRLTELDVMSGYECGGPGEPCDDQNRPYFRPFNNVTRGQASKIVANTFYPNCQTP